MNQAFTGWLPIRRAQIHRTHGEVIAVRADRDRAALLPLPASDYQVVDRHLRRVGTDPRVRAWPGKGLTAHRSRSES